MDQQKQAESVGVPKSIYANQAASSFGNGVAAPFIPYYATRLGATGVELGWMQSVQNLFPNVLQVPWGRLSDRIGRRAPFIIVGMTLSALAYLMMIASSTVLLVILAVLFQSIATSAVVPAWSALLGEKVPTATRGKGFGRISLLAGVSSIVGGLVAAAMVRPRGPADASDFHLPFATAVIAGIVAAGILLSLREKKTRSASAMEDNNGSNNDAARTHDFRYFVKVQSFYSFFMSFMWPLMPITTVVVLGASNEQIVILSLLGSISTVAIQSQVGKLMDRVGPVSLINLSRIMLIAVPFVYAFATSIYHLYLLNILLGAAIAIINVAFAGYILDLSPPSGRGEGFARYNAAIGAVTFFGSLIGGYLATYLGFLWRDVWLGLFAVYMLSFGGRIVGSFFSLRMRDSRRYPAKMRDVGRQLLGQFQAVAEKLYFFKPH